MPEKEGEDAKTALKTTTTDMQLTGEILTEAMIEHSQIPRTKLISLPRVPTVEETSTTERLKTTVSVHN